MLSLKFALCWLFKQAHEVCEGQNEPIMSLMTDLKIIQTFVYCYENLTFQKEI
jgi:hypothetical protein